MAWRVNTLLTTAAGFWSHITQQERPKSSNSTVTKFIVLCVIHLMWLCHSLPWPKRCRTALYLSLISPRDTPSGGPGGSNIRLIKFANTTMSFSETASKTQNSRETQFISCALKISATKTFLNSPPWWSLLWRWTIWAAPTWNVVSTQSTKWAPKLLKHTSWRNTLNLSNSILRKACLRLNNTNTFRRKWLSIIGTSGM